MTVDTLVKYLTCFDGDLEVVVCKRTRATLPFIKPDGVTEEEVDVPVLCIPTIEIECIMHDPVSYNAPVLLVI